MKLESKDFEHNGDIPSRFTCQGEDVSPQLSWTDAPAGTKSFALSCRDPDAPGGNFTHWLACDIPSNVTGLEQGEKVPGKELMTDFGKRGYGGPCPPSGKHRYVFTLYALDVEKLEGVTEQDFMEKIQEHAIESAQLIGLYQKK